MMVQLWRWDCGRGRWSKQTVSERHRETGTPRIRMRKPLLPDIEILSRRESGQRRRCCRRRLQFVGRTIPEKNTQRRVPTWLGRWDEHVYLWSRWSMRPAGVLVPRWKARCTFRRSSSRRRCTAPASRCSPSCCRPPAHPLHGGLARLGLRRAVRFRAERRCLSREPTYVDAAKLSTIDSVSCSTPWARPWESGPVLKHLDLHVFAPWLGRFVRGQHRDAARRLI